MRTFSFIFVLMCIKMDSCNCSSNCPIVECQKRIRGMPPLNVVHKHGTPIPVFGAAMMLRSPRGHKECYVDMNQFLDLYTFNGTDLIAVFGFRCKNYDRVHFRNLTDSHSRPENVMSFLQVEGCRISISDYNKLANVTNFEHVLFRSHVILENDTVCDENRSDEYQYGDCDLLQNVVDVWVENPPNNKDTSLAFIIECSKVFPLMREALFSNLGWKEIPKEIITKFPNLQSLELPKNKLSFPPAEFPWTDSFVYYTKNMSRTTYMDEQYAKVYNMEIESNLTRRVFRLDNNFITNLTDFEFHGYLHMISIENNQLHSIGQYTFSRVKGLQHLSLAENKITILPANVFKSLRNLRHLNLQKNHIKKLDSKIFKDLNNLVYLNLANNSLKYLEKGLFVRLVSLKELHLEFNLLSKISPHVFPILTVSLNMIFLNNNPLHEFPEFLFYIRKLRKADLRNAYISFDNFSNVLDRIINPYFIESTAETTSSVDMDLTKNPEHMRSIDLTNNSIKLFGVDSNISKNKKHIQKLEIVLKHFRFILRNNPLHCDCNIISFTNVIDNFRRNASLVGNEYFFNDWKCTWPEELSNRPMLQVKEHETYCRKNVSSCPSGCICYVRSVSGIIIVDCRNRYLSKFPKVLPSGILELWFQANNISSLPFLPYLKQVKRLYLTGNILEQINGKAMIALKNVQILHLDSNMLASVPPEMGTLESEEIFLKGNPFKCDCNTLWMKSWILKRVSIIKDMTSLACNNKDGEGKQFIDVPNEEFICEEEFDSVKHMVIPAVTCSVSIVIFLSSLCIMYIFRLEVKVLLYIYFGIHPFDKDEKSGEEQIDVVIVHSPLITEWIFENIVQFLEQNGRQYVVCEMMRDFVAGFSYQENIAGIVRQSKRMMVVFSKDMMDEDDLVKVAWNEAQEKIKELRTNYVIFMNHEISVKQIQNKELKRYVKRGRCIDTQDSLFREKILYSMPDYVQAKDNTDRMRILPDLRETIQTMYATPDENVDQTGSRLFIAYSDRDIMYTLKHLKPSLEKLGHTLYLPDRDFTPGASKEENILRAVDTCVHTLFILSGEHLQDEWSLFTFRCATEKSLRQKCNHLIVLKSEDINLDDMDEEVKYYVKTHVTLNIGDTWYWDRLVSSIPNLSDKGLDKEMETDVDKNILVLNKRNLEMNKVNEDIVKHYNNGTNKVVLDGIIRKHGNECTCEKCKLQQIETKMFIELEMKDKNDVTGEIKTMDLYGENTELANTDTHTEKL